jgi:hypothetical protein
MPTRVGKVQESEKYTVLLNEACSRILGASPNSEHDESHTCKAARTTFCLKLLVASIIDVTTGGSLAIYGLPNVPVEAPRKDLGWLPPTRNPTGGGRMPDI